MAAVLELAKVYANSKSTYIAEAIHKLRLATSNEESKQALKVRRTLKIEQRENSKETRNDFEESSKNYSEMYTKKHQKLRI